MKNVAIRLACVTWMGVAALGVPASAVEPISPPAGEWNFRALLDGKPIGQHRFSLSAQGDERRLVSDASFAVKFLGLTAYRYRHKVTEQWRGDCLAALNATTDDDGKPSSVRADRQGDALRVTGPAGVERLPGCVFSFAYWNPSLQKQTQLLNSQTGKFESVQVSRLGDGLLDVRGKSVPAVHWRITGPEAPIDIWYSPEGDWLGLDSIVAGGRKLSYRLD